MAKRRHGPYTTEPYWSVRARRVHSAFVYVVSVLTALIPIADAILAWTTGRAFDSAAVTSAVSLLGVLNAAAHGYAKHGVRYHD